MTVAVEIRVLAGQTLVAAIVRNRLHKGTFAGQPAVSGDRGPCALLIRQGDRLDGFSPQGAAMSSAQIDALCPGVVAQVMGVALS